MQPKGLTVPLGETRSAKWVGLSGAPEVAVSDPGVAEAVVAGGEVRVTGLSRGNADVVLTWGERSLSLPVQVRPWAARLPAKVEVVLSGDRPDFEEALRRVLLGRSSPHPQAKTEIRFLKPPALGAEVPVKVTSTGTGLLPADATVSVRFVSQSVQPARANSLVMSNRPEKVSAEGLLLRQALYPGATRLLYHHRNEPGQPERFLEVLLRNGSAAPVRVFVVLNGVGPSQDEIFAGHLASKGFVQRLLDGRGVVLRLAPGETVLVDRLRMKPAQTVSGMGWLQPVGDASGLELTVRSVDLEGASADVDLAQPGGGPFPTGRGAFPAEVQATYTYDFGSRYNFIALGEAPYTVDPGTGEANPGNFGVVYRLRLVLRNPTAEPREGWLDFHPRGGPARGLFYVDDTFVETPMAQNATPFRLGRWTLSPGEEREVVLETFPQSGSNYPVNLVLGSQFLNLPSREQPQGPELPPRWLP